MAGILNAGCITSEYCGLARLAEAVGNGYFLAGGRWLAANPPAVMCLLTRLSNSIHD